MKESSFYNRLNSILNAVLVREFYNDKKGMWFYEN